MCCKCVSERGVDTSSAKDFVTPSYDVIANLVTTRPFAYTTMASKLKLHTVVSLCPAWLATQILS